MPQRPISANSDIWVFVGFILLNLVAKESIYLAYFGKYHMDREKVAREVLFFHIYNCHVLDDSKLIFARRNEFQILS